MCEVLEIFPGAQRALFRRYQSGGRRRFNTRRRRNANCDYTRPAA